MTIGAWGAAWAIEPLLRDLRQEGNDARYRAALGRADIRGVELPMAWDVDEPADLARWQALRSDP
jgi:glycosyltransferase A (GT-A) superfamily protein (DUF2064 family)